MSQNQSGISPSETPKTIIVTIGIAKLELRRVRNSGYACVKATNVDNHTSTSSEFRAQVGTASLVVKHSTGRVAIDHDYPSFSSNQKRDSTLEITASGEPESTSSTNGHKRGMGELLDQIHGHASSLTFRGERHPA